MSFLFAISKETQGPFNFQSEECFKAVKDTYYGSHDCLWLSM